MVENPSAMLLKFRLHAYVLSGSVRGEQCGQDHILARDQVVFADHAESIRAGTGITQAYLDVGSFPSSAMTFSSAGK